MSGIAAVHARIQQIQAEFSPASSTSFASVLSAQSSPAAAASASATSASPATPALAAPTSLAPPPANAEWASKLPPEGQAWAGEITRAADEAGVDPRLLAALVRAESNFQPQAGSSAGAIGLAQLMPGTAAELGVDPHDPVQNLRGGARYLAQQLDRFGSPELALAAYNAGPGRVLSAGGIPNISETQTYVARVMDYYRELQ